MNRIQQRRVRCINPRAKSPLNVVAKLYEHLANAFHLPRVAQISKNVDIASNN